MAPIHKARNAVIQKTTTAPQPIVAAIYDELGFADDAAAIRIAEESRQHAPDATDEEIAFHTREQARRFKNMRRVENALGLVIKQVPKCFEGQSFQRFRETTRSSGGEVEEESDQHAQSYEQILVDPKTSPEEKRIARLVLGRSDLP